MDSLEAIINRETRVERESLLPKPDRSLSPATASPSPVTPFLDEDVIRTLLSIPLWEIADLDQPSGKGDKKILGEVAQLLGLHEASVLPKKSNSELQILSLGSNGISGPFPSDFSKLGNLTGLYLQFNNFFGPLPSDFSSWKSLSIINLSNNGFTGSIPSSIANLTHLTALNLANNSLSGELPDLNLPILQVVDLSNNNLTGIVPRSLQRFPSWAFLGNNLSAGNSSPPILPPNAQPSKKSTKLSEPAILGIIIGGCALGFVVLAFLMIVCRSKTDGEKGVSAKSQKKEVSAKKAISGSRDGNGKLDYYIYTYTFQLTISN
ncbi:hypothetical protein ACSBR1_013663 [Camellia fascicularis]